MKAIALVALLFAVSEAAQRAIPYDEWVSNGGYPLPEALRTEADKFKYPVEGLNDSRIVGGAVAPSGLAPFQISLRRTSHSCGGSIYNPRTIITAAHCTAGASASSLSVRYGSLQHASGGTLVSLTRIAQHSGYNSATIDNDISLLITSAAISYGTNAQPVTIASAGSDPATGTAVTVTGWGTTSSGGSTLPADLRYVEVSIVARATCNSNYGSGITNNMICAGVNGGGKDSCQGDSGGPLFLSSNKQQVGIVSWGRGCALSGYPGVYTRITNYNSWISSNAQN